MALEKSRLTDIADSLEDLGYMTDKHDDIKFSEKLTDIFNAGRDCVEFTELVSWLCSHIRLIMDIKDSVSPTTNTDDTNHFLMEIADFLRSIDCIHKHLFEGSIDERLVSVSSRLCLVDYLCSELQALHIILNKKPDFFSQTLNMEVSESEQAKQMMSIVRSLNITEKLGDMDEVDVKVLMDGVSKEVSDRITTLHYSTIDLYTPVICQSLTADQWPRLEAVNSELVREYSLRRHMILKRLDVTIQSFTWSGRVKGKEDAFSSSYSSIRDNLSSTQCVSMADLVAASRELLQDAKVCSDDRLHVSSVKKVMMGEVPCRGGNPRSTGPEAEMPKFKARNPFAGGDRGGRGGGHRGQHRGKRKHR